MDWLTNPESWIALATLTALEIVLGIDNVVFISILASKLPLEQQSRARRVGLGLAMLMRIGLLFSIVWIIRLTEPLFSVFNEEISGRDLILLVGGLFLLAKSTHEIHQRLEGAEGHASAKVRASFAGVIVQVMVLAWAGHPAVPASPIPATRPPARSASAAAISPPPRARRR